ncbi:MAG: arabinofuranosidase catalytic domain-containing protein [Polyangiaceae bacterium]
MPPMNKLRSLGTSRKPHVVLDVTGFSGSVAHRNVSAIATAGTTMLKGPSGNHFALKAGDARPGTFVTEWNGARPPESTPIKKGAIILGDGSKGGIGTFFEGAITSVRPSDATDNAVQANVVAAHYGR